MADSLGDILGKRGLDEPPEIKKIKEFVQAEVGITPEVRITKTLYVVSLPSAPAASNLRFKLFQLQRSLGHERKIIIKIV
jgi:hypothetical protein